MAGNNRSGDDYISNYSFEVQLGLMIKISFSKVSNIGSEAEIDVRAEGGNNDRMLFFEKPKRRPDTIMFSMGWGTGLKVSLLSCLVEGLKIDDIMILVKKGATTRKIFYIEQGIISKIKFSDLDALHGEVMIKTLELQHTGLVEIAM